MLMSMLAFALKILQKNPFETLMFVGQVPLLFFSMIFSGFYVVGSLQKKRGREGDDFYYIALMFCIIVVSALAAKINFQQPIVYGVLAERTAIPAKKIK